MDFNEAMCKSIRKWVNFLKRKGMRLVKDYQGYHYHSGFFYTPSGKLWYWLSGDNRYGDNTILIRTAQHEKDYHGGSNWCLRSESDFDKLISWREG